MQWMGGRRSTNIEDRRGMRPAMVGGGLGAIILTLIALYFGVDPGVIVNSSNPSADTSSAPVDESARDFAATVLGYTEDTWSDVFRQAGRTYTPPKLVLFDGAVESSVLSLERKRLRAAWTQEDMASSWVCTSEAARSVPVKEMAPATSRVMSTTTIMAMTSAMPRGLGVSRCMGFSLHRG